MKNIYRLRFPRRLPFIGEPPRPGSLVSPVAGGILPPLTVRGRSSRKAIIFLTGALPPLGVSGGVLSPLVVRSDFRRGGRVLVGKVPLVTTLTTPQFSIFPSLVTVTSRYRRGTVLIGKNLGPTSTPPPVVVPVGRSGLILPPLVVRRLSQKKGTFLKGGGGLSLVPLQYNVSIPPKTSFLGRAGQVIRTRVFGIPPVNVAGGVHAPLIVRSDFRRPGLVVKTRALAPPIVNVAGGVLNPLVVRSDFRRGGRVIWERVPYPQATKPLILPIKVVRSSYTHKGLVRLLPTPSPQAYIPRYILPNKVFSRSFNRAGVVVRGRLAGPGAIGRLIPDALVVRRDFWRRGIVYLTKSLLKPSVAGGILPPSIFRRDFSRGGVVVRVSPMFIFTPSGARVSPIIQGWDGDISATLIIGRFG